MRSISTENVSAATPVEKPTAQQEDEVKEANESEHENKDETEQKDGKKNAKGKQIGKKKRSQSERKRGPARPYRKLPQETLLLRIQKLQKRIDRTSAQAEEGKNFLSKYTREQAFREAEAVSTAA